MLGLAQFALHDPTFTGSGMAHKPWWTVAVSLRRLRFLADFSLILPLYKGHAFYLLSTRTKVPFEYSVLLFYLSEKAS